jgi:hypothetical protein
MDPDGFVLLLRGRKLTHGDLGVDFLALDVTIHVRNVISHPT